MVNPFWRFAILEICNVSEQQAEGTQASAETRAAAETQGSSGSVGAGSILHASSGTPAEKAIELAVSVPESRAIAPDHETPPKPDTPKPDTPKPEIQKPDGPKLGTSKPQAPRPDGKLMIMAPGERVWHDHSANPEVKSETRTAASPAAPRRGFPAMAAMLALAAIAGAIGGALATSGLAHVAGAAATTPSTSALQTSIARIDADVLALKAGLERTSRLGVTQFNKTNDRLDKIEKAEAEPAAKLARLTEAVDKLRAAPAPAAAAQPASREATGSVKPAQAVATAASSTAPAAPPKQEVGRLPTVEGWALADVGYGGALIENRRGTYEVYAGDYIRGLGRINAIRKQDGHWVVVTSKGLIVAR
jgi:hypothetical protein